MLIFVYMCACACWEFNMFAYSFQVAHSSRLMFGSVFNGRCPTGPPLIKYSLMLYIRWARSNTLAFLYKQLGKGT